MTTAARPTFDTARGGSGRGEKDLSALSKQYSSRDLPGHKKLKYRSVLPTLSTFICLLWIFNAPVLDFREKGQGTTEDLRHRDFRDELERREKDASGKPLSSIPAVVRRAIEANASGSSSSKRTKTDSTANLDADDPVDNDSSDSDDSDGDDDSDDDTAALLAELNKIKRERVVETEQKEAERNKEEERIRMENILSGNPLINYTAAVPRGDLKIKRRWDDDVVFKNCARSEPDKKKPTFINDSLRSDFHKKFMEKYIK